jgi:N-dimethylarginine dimethylaminohydrolase
MTFNRTALMSDALHFSAEQAINPYYGDPVVHTDVASREHSAIADLLTQAGVSVIQVPSPVDSQDGVYTANWALVRGDKAVLARLPNVRKAEEAYAEKILTDLGKEVFHVPEGFKFSGQGDALPCGDLLFCGSGYRSDPEAHAFAAETLGYRRIQLQTVPELKNGEPVINAISGWPDSFFYDIDLSLSIIKMPEDGQKGLIAYCPDAFTPESQRILAELDEVDKIEVSIEEATRAFACNLVSTGQTVIMGAHAPQFTAALEARGLTVLTTEISELVKGGGYIRCTTLTLD